MTHNFTAVLKSRPPDRLSAVSATPRTVGALIVFTRQGAAVCVELSVP